jgi:outer membrane lipoprotein carrier protein
MKLFWLILSSSNENNLINPPSPLPTGQAGPFAKGGKPRITGFHFIVMKITLMVLFFCYFSLNVTAYSFASEKDENVLRIKKAYENIRDLKGSFVQKSIIKDLNRTDNYEGEFFIKYPLKIKWVYTGKASQDITIKNDTVLIYKKGDNQAYTGKFNMETYGQTPVALLSGFGDIEEEFNISGKANSLILIPKKPMGNITSVKIKISEDVFPIRSFTIHDGQSNVIEIELKEIKINSGLEDSIFEFSLPEGVQIYEQNP